MESNKGELSVVCTAVENRECHCSVEGTGQSAGEGASQIGDWAASAKHNMSTACLQTILEKDVIRGSISEIAHSLGFTEIGGLLILPHGAGAEARAQEEEVVVERPCSLVASGHLQGTCRNAWESF